MCNKLLQAYACAHTKTICTTPCPHALETGYQIPGDETSISRSDSTVSSIMPSTQHDEQPSRLRPPPSSLPFRSPPSSPTSPLSASHLSTLSQPSPVGPPPGYPRHHTAPSTSHTDPRSAPSQKASPSVALTTSPSLTHLRPKPLTIEPNYCPYHFPRYLPQSNQPCLDCYMLPEWEHLSDRWMKWYGQDHPMEKPEDVEHNSGIGALKEKEGQMQRSHEGLLNVFVHGDESAGRID